MRREISSLLDHEECVVSCHTCTYLPRMSISIHVPQASRELMDSRRSQRRRSSVLNVFLGSKKPSSLGNRLTPCWATSMRHAPSPNASGFCDKKPPNPYIKCGVCSIAIVSSPRNIRTSRRWFRLHAMNALPQSPHSMARVQSPRRECRRSLLAVVHRSMQMAFRPTSHRLQPLTDVHK